EFMEQAASFFEGIMTPDAILAEVTKLAVPLLGDLCVAELRDADGSTSGMESAHVRSSDAEMLKSLEGAFGSFTAIRSAVVHAYESGAPQLVEDFQPVLRTDAGVDGVIARMPALIVAKKLEIASLMIVPIVRRGTSFGHLILGVTQARRRYRTFDFPL